MTKNLSHAQKRNDLLPVAQETVPRPDSRTALLVPMVPVVLGLALHAMAVVLVPLVAAILIALSVMPLRDRERDHVPERLGRLGTAAAMTLILVVLCLFFSGLWFAVQLVLSQLPAQPGQIIEALQSAGSETGQGSLTENAATGAVATGQGGSPAARAAAEGAEEGGTPVELLPESASWLFRMLGDRLAGAGAGLAATILNSALATSAGLTIILVLTLLILIESEEWQAKVAAVAGARTEWRLTESAAVIAGKVRAYLVLRTGLGLATAALYAFWLWLLDVDLLLVWALATFLLSFVPVVGSLVAGLLPVAYALLSRDWGTVLIVGAGLLVIEQVLGSFISPKLEGDHIALSPLVVLVSLLFWGWIWGIAGAFLAVPVTVSLAVLGAHVPRLRPWALLLTDRTRMRDLSKVTQPE